MLLLPPLRGSNGDGMCTPWVSPFRGFFTCSVGFTRSVGFTHGCGPSHLRRSFMAQQRFSVTGDFWRLIIGAACLCASLATAPRFRYGGTCYPGVTSSMDFTPGYYPSAPTALFPAVLCWQDMGRKLCRSEGAQPWVQPTERVESTERV